MNPKIKKIDAEYEKNAAKITELQARQQGDWARPGIRAGPGGRQLLHRPGQPL